MKDKILAFFHKLRDYAKRLIAKMRADDQERGCWNCKHTNCSYDDVPCCWCDESELWEWEAKE